MKNLLFIAIVICIALLACSRRTVSTKQEFTKYPSEKIQNESPMTEVSDPAKYLITAGKTIYETKCSRCHGLKPVSDYTADRWDVILKTMEVKAKLTETEKQQVTAFVKANAKK